MQNYKIPRKEILKLYESSLNEVSAHSIGQWLKTNTEDEFSVFPRNHIISIIRYIESDDLDIRINEIKQYL